MRQKAESGGQKACMRHTEVARVQQMATDNTMRAATHVQTMPQRQNKCKRQKEGKTPQDHTRPVT